jgi:ParB family chromosome partitioning protein
VSGDLTYKFEVICGARRHWSVSWLRAHDRPDFKFVVEPRELSDEEAFRIADLENRSRKDLSDYERATDYARAIERYYDGSQQRMVERLQVSKSWLSRYLELAKLPPEVIACFASPHGIGITHAASLAPLLHNMHLRPKILAAAELLKGEQAERAKGGQPPIPPSQVVSKLCLAAAKAKKAAVGDESVLDQTGQLLLKIRQEGRGGVQFSVPRNRLADPKAVAEAIEIWLNQHFKKR